MTHPCSMCSRDFETKRGCSIHESTGHSKRYQDSDWLTKKYEKEGLSGYEISDLCDVEENVIYNYLNQFDIETRGKEEAAKNWWGKADEELKEEYSERMMKIGSSHSITYWDTYSDEGKLKVIDKIRQTKIGDDNPKWVNRTTSECSVCSSEIVHRETIDRNLCGNDKCKSTFMENENPMNNPEYRRKVGDAHRGTPKPKLSEIRKGMKPTYPEPFTVEETGHRVRSGWEEDVDIYLHRSDVEYKYEPRGFEYGNGRRYYPDFIVEDKLVIEVKGWPDDKSIQKAKEFTTAYPEYTYIVIGSKSCQSEMSYDKFIEYESFKHRLNKHLSNAPTEP